MINHDEQGIARRLGRVVGDNFVEAGNPVTGLVRTGWESLYGQSLAPEATMEALGRLATEIG